MRFLNRQKWIFLIFTPLLRQLMPNLNFHTPSQNKKSNKEVSNMPYIQELKKTNKNDPRSFKIKFNLGNDSNGNPITRTSIRVAPPELCEEEILQNVRQTAKAYEKVLEGFCSKFKLAFDR
ncbi:MAG: hypothetical protein E7479_07415 [Ruminococcaceae bacterium]|nr:hypothetical protein [Oscillospiraceae bacterium]